MLYENNTNDAKTTKLCAITCWKTERMKNEIRSKPVIFRVYTYFEAIEIRILSPNLWVAQGVS